MKNRREKKWMKNMSNEMKFPFTYDGIANIYLNPSHNIKQFRPSQFVIIEFNTHFINFRFKTNLNNTLNYNFRFQSIYLIEDNKPRLMSIPAKWE